MVRVEVCGASRVDMDEIRAMMDSYLGELATHREIGKGAVDAASYPYFDVYWSEQGRHPFVVKCEKEVAGFVFVRDPDSTGMGRFHIAEFYVRPPFRRRGVGRQVLSTLWKQFPGEWELQAHLKNKNAVEFWRSCIHAEAENPPNETEIQAADGRRLHFNFKIR